MSRDGSVCWARAASTCLWLFLILYQNEEAAQGLADRLMKRCYNTGMCLMFFVWVTSAGISLNSDKQNSSSTTSAKTSSTFPRVAMVHQTLISWVFSRARDSQAPCPMLIYSWLLIPKGCEVLTEGPAQMLKFMSIFLEKIRLEKVQGSNRECKITSVYHPVQKRQ